jgi:predicted DNA-binding protein
MMKRKQIYIEKEQDERLKRAAAERNVSEAKIIREAIDRYLVRLSPPPLKSMEDHPLWKIVGIIDDPEAPTDGSENYDIHLYGPRRPASEE